MSHDHASFIIRQLHDDVHACTLCAADLPLGPRPIFKCSRSARILIASQAPGKKAHISGIPFDDASGKRLREWMGIGEAAFYDADQVAILPMGLCYPGKGRSGDLPPRPECAPAWRQRLLDTMPNIRLTLVIGQYAHAWHLPRDGRRSLTATVKNWPAYGKHLLPLPHPSPRNNVWLSNNRWFADDVLPELKTRVRKALQAESN